MWRHNWKRRPHCGRHKQQRMLDWRNPFRRDKFINSNSDKHSLQISCKVGFNNSAGMITHVQASGPFLQSCDNISLCMSMYSCSCKMPSTGCSKLSPSNKASLLKRHPTSFGAKNLLRTFALIVSAHPYCVRNSLPRHALSMCAVEEMWTHTALVGTLISISLIS